MTTKIESQDFDLSQFAFDTVDTESWNEANTRKPRPLDAGDYTLKISEIRNMGRNKNDAAWYDLSVECVDEQARRVTGYFSMPTNSPLFTRQDGSSSKFEIVKFKELASSLGLTVEDPKDVQKAIMSLAKGIPTGKFNDRTVKVTLGYTNDHLKFVSPGCYQVVNKKGELLENAPEVFENAESANEWYGTTHKKVNGDPRKLQFVQITRFGDAKLRTK